jgi:hypothetical protein
LSNTDDGLLNRLVIEAKCEAERQHAEGEGPCDFAPKSRPGHFRVVAQGRLQVPDVQLQIFDFPTSAESQSRHKRHWSLP